MYQGVGQDGRPCLFRAAVREILRWQASFRTYYASDIYVGQEGKDLVSRSLQGKSEAGRVGACRAFLRFFWDFAG